MKKLIFVLFISPFVVVAQSKTEGILFHSAVTIPEELKKNAHTVFRLDEATLDVTAPGKYTYKAHEKYTILSKEGEHRLMLQYAIDKFHQMDEIEVKVFNSLGIEVEKYKRKDFTVTAAYDGISLVTDNKIMRLRVSAPEYPCTIEINYTRQVTSYINLPRWYFQVPGESVEVSRYTVKIPAEIDIRHKTKHINVEPVITTANGKKCYVWETKNLLAKKPEPGAGGFIKIPHLLIGANEFEFDGHRGDSRAWKGMGIWYNNLVKNINVLSDPYKNEIRNIVSGASNDVEKVRMLYTYLQKNFRYVSIQLGIGGFKPFPADFVHEKRYGDCKALSNYMEACLQAINLKGYSAWINAGVDGSPVDADFPIDVFNHQILCVPINKDTIWLECTSSKVDFAHLGNFTENRNALLLTENGGVLVPTPRSKSHQNRFSSVTNVHIQEDGSGKTESLITTTGEYKYDQIDLSQEKEDVQKNYFVNGLGFPNPDEFELKFGEKDAQPLKTIVHLKMEKINDFMAGSKMFLKPRMYKLSSIKLPATENRMEDFVFACPFEKTDTTIFKLPEGYKVDAMPKEKQLKFEYGLFTTRYWYDENQKAVYSTANLVLTNHIIPAQKFQSAKSFFDDVFMDDSQRIVIKKE